jgi:hypothetical protein
VFTDYEKLLLKCIQIEPFSNHLMASNSFSLLLENAYGICSIGEKNYDSYFYTGASQSKIVITKLDTINKIIAGTFEFNASTNDSVFQKRETVSITPRHGSCLHERLFMYHTIFQYFNISQPSVSSLFQLFIVAVQK